MALSARSSLKSLLPAVWRSDRVAEEERYRQRLGDRKLVRLVILAELGLAEWCLPSQVILRTVRIG